MKKVMLVITLNLILAGCAGPSQQVAADFLVTEEQRQQELSTPSLSAGDQQSFIQLQQAALRSGEQFDEFRFGLSE